MLLLESRRAPSKAGNMVLGSRRPLHLLATRLGSVHAPSPDMSRRDGSKRRRRWMNKENEENEENENEDEKVEELYLC